MTCIAAVAKDGVVVMGGDAAGTNQALSQSIRAQPKVFKNGEFLMGYTSSFRMGQLLEHKFTPPARTEKQSAMEYMVFSFVEEVRRTFKTGGYLKIESNEEKGGVFLVGYRGELFCIESDFQVATPLLQYDAVGCGADLALGSLHATASLGETLDKHELRIQMALEAAREFSAGVRPPYTILS